MKPLNVLSLFDGISCGQVALERAGIPVQNYYASEIDKNAIAVTMKNYPRTIQCGDVRNLKGSDFGEIDLLIGGSPCQSLSIVLQQTRNDFEGKSSLFFEYARLLKEVKPKYFLLENVASMKDECKEIISQYVGAEPVLINSNSFSAQDRPRYYWTNIPFDKNLSESKLCLKDILEEKVSEKYFYSYPLLNIDMSKKYVQLWTTKTMKCTNEFSIQLSSVQLLQLVGGEYTEKSFRQWTSKKTDTARIRKTSNIA